MDRDELSITGETFIQSFQQISNEVAVRDVLLCEWVGEITFLGLPLRGALNDQVA